MEAAQCMENGPHFRKTGMCGPFNYVCDQEWNARIEVNSRLRFQSPE